MACGVRKEFDGASAPYFKVWGWLAPRVTGETEKGPRTYRHAYELYRTRIMCHGFQRNHLNPESIESRRLITNLALLGLKKQWKPPPILRAKS